MNVIAPKTGRTAKDYASDQEVRWCPGCGDYAILKAMQKFLADEQVDPANTVFVSGIGCSSRFPYYLSTYGFHTIHGRAPAIASGVKLANPDLDVWVITGDGDGLSIGGNHLLHLLRRNIDVQVLLFNNEIYGLTKGQYSPTSRPGTRSPSSPSGSLERPVSPVAFALGAGARFIARGIDTQLKPLVEVMKAARDHRGTSFVEIFQNCLVYNDAVFAGFTEKPVAADAQIVVRHGKPLIFGTGGTRGLRLASSGLALEVVKIGEDGVTPDDILVHDERNATLAGLLAAMTPPVMPMALGVLYRDPAPSLDASLSAAVEKTVPSAAALDALFRRGDTWHVGASGIPDHPAASGPPSQQ